MEAKNKICQRKGNICLLPFRGFLFVLILFFTSCKQKPEPYSILEFTGDENVMNYSKTLYIFSHKPDSAYPDPAALLASDGDLISYGDDFFVYRKSLGNKLQLKSTDEGGYINGKISTLCLRRVSERAFQSLMATRMSLFLFSSFLFLSTTIAS